MTALTIRPEERRNERADRLRAQGHATDRPGDRLHRYFTASLDSKASDVEYAQGVLGAIKAHNGDVPAIAGNLGIGERTLRRWMGAYPAIGKAIRVAALKERLRAEEARL